MEDTGSFFFFSPKEVQSYKLEKLSYPSKHKFDSTIFCFFPCGCDGSWNGTVNLAGIWGVYRLITVKFQRMLSVPVEVNHLIDH